jgi:hypothetical protein
MELYYCGSGKGSKHPAQIFIIKMSLFRALDVIKEKKS